MPDTLSFSSLPSMPPIWPSGLFAPPDPNIWLSSLFASNMKASVSDDWFYAGAQ